MIVAVILVGVVRPVAAAPSTPVDTEALVASWTPALSAVRVTATTLNVRAQPSTTAMILGRMKAGDLILPVAATDNATWWEIRYAGQQAYIWSAGTTPVFTHIVAQTRASEPAPLQTPGANGHPTLADLWEGKAHFELQVQDTGLPMGESDTMRMANGELWSYLHASQRSADAVDQCGAAVEFPGCTVVYRSTDGGMSFATAGRPTCQFTCRQCPCRETFDHISQQQYPRVATADGIWYAAYEWRGNVILRRSLDGVTWSLPEQVRDTGIWYRWYRTCSTAERIGVHPFVPYDYQCLAGGPPGLWIENGVVTVFFAQGQNPGSMGCAYGAVGQSANTFRRCAANPLFTGAASYGPVDVTGGTANPYFGFRTLSSAEILRVGDQLYMLFEGVRGPARGDAGDTQFGLGLARTTAGVADGPWEVYANNPLLVDLPGNIGLGHADLIVLDGQTILYTSLDGVHRSRLALVWSAS